MQRIIISEQEREQTIRPVGIGDHLIHLCFGLLLGLVLMIFEQPNQADPAAPQQPRRRWRPIVILLGILVGLTLVVMLMIGQ